MDRPLPDAGLAGRRSGARRGIRQHAGVEREPRRRDQGMTAYVIVPEAPVHSPFIRRKERLDVERG